MKTITKQNIAEVFFSVMLAMGIVIIANAQEDTSPQKRVRVEIEVSEDGKTSTSTQEIELNRSSINGELDDMVEEIEMILEEAVRDIEETDLEIVIRRNHNGARPHRYRHRMMGIPDAPSLWHTEGEPRAFLGVVATKLDEEELEELNIDQGSVIEDVVEGSAAERAGLKEGDIITSIDGEDTPDFSSLAKAIRSHDPGDEVDIDIVRDGNSEELSVELGEQRHRAGHFKNFMGDDFDFDFDFDDDGISFEYEPKDLEKKAFLGIEGKSVEDDGGVDVTKIFEGSSAEKAGLEEGDRITELNGEKVEDIGELVEIINDLEPGDDLKIQFDRNGKKMKKTASLGNKKEAGLFGGSGHGRHPHKPHMKRSYRFHFMDIEDMEDDEIEEFATKSGEEFETSNSLNVDNLIITPNPNDGQFRVKFELEEAGDMELKIFDSTRRKIVDESFKDFEGIFSNEYDLNETDSGIYILSITQNGKGKMSKIVKQ